MCMYVDYDKAYMPVQRCVCEIALYKLDSLLLLLF